MIKLLSLGLAAAFVLSGCGGEAEAQTFDAFLRKEYNLIEKADLTLFHRCLASAGFPQEQPKTSGELFERLDEAPLQPRSETEARKYGFGTPIPAQPAQILRSDPAYLAATDRCQATAFEQLGDPAVRDSYANLGNRLGLELGRRVKMFLQRESASFLPCLAAQGFPLPKGATYDSRKNVTQFGIKIGTNPKPAAQPVKTLPGGAKLRPGIPERPYVPTANESRLAVAFARCGDSTGLFGRIDAQLPGMQREIVRSHAAEFAELNPKLLAMAAKAAEVLRP